MKVLETGINHENAYEDNQLEHPLEGLTFDEIKTHLEEKSKQYPLFTNLRYEKNTRSHGYGAMTAWYSLVGDYVSELAEELD